MKIIRVIVDKLPKNCCFCPLMGEGSEWGYCLSGEELDKSYCVRCPDWCPLVTIEDFGKTNGALRTESEE